jgi:glutamate racemase
MLDCGVPITILRKRKRYCVRQPIAILDSGVGGLTVAKEVMRRLPHERIVYFGDTARAPYGSRSPEEIVAFTEQIVCFLRRFDPKMIVMACNTATAVALDRIRSQVDVPVLGVIHPGARAAVRWTRSRRVGVIGTERTIRSRAYNKALEAIAPHIVVYSQACPRLVPLVEKGLFGSDEALGIVRESLMPLCGLGIDTLILGCTHYPFLQDHISKALGPQVGLINSAEETAVEVRDVLVGLGQLSESPDRPSHHFFCSGDPQVFRAIARKWLGFDVRVTPFVRQVPHMTQMI